MKRLTVNDLTLREKIGQTGCFNPVVAARLGSERNILDYFKDNPFGTMWTAGHLKLDFVNMAGETEDGKVDKDFDMKLPAFIEAVNRVIRVPFLPAADSTSPFPAFPSIQSPTGFGASRDPALLFEEGACIGREMALTGAKYSWCPVADNASPFNSVMINRCYSCDVELAGKMVAAFVKGMQSEGVAATLKHFPGAGKDEYRDPHFSDQTIAEEKETWYARQGRIFKDGVDAGAMSVMTSHGSFPAIDDEKIGGRYVPASMSKKIVTDLLKGEMGFTGVVITDAVDMRALNSVFPTKAQMYAKILNAGVDIILGPMDNDYIDIVERCVKDGIIPEERIDDACERVLAMKEKLGLFENPVPVVSEEKRRAAIEKTREFARRAAPKTITWCSKADTGFLPVKKENVKRVQIIYLAYRAVPNAATETLKDEFEKHGALVDVTDHIDSGLHMKTMADSHDLIVYALCVGAHNPFGFASFFGEKCLNFLYALLYGKEKSVGLSLGSPFTWHMWFPACENFLNVYSDAEEPVRAAVRGLYGECELTGTHPFDPNPLAPRQ